MKSTPNNDFDQKTIFRQLERVLKSDEFKRSVRLSSFLRYVVEKSLQNSSGDLKGYTIGIDVFGKPDGFDPDTDASVRVEAVRLRKALALYYHESGKKDQVIITIPKGSYKPQFLKNPEKRKGLLYKGVLVIVVLALVLTGMFVRHLLLSGSTAISPDVPLVAVLPFHQIGGEGISEGFTYKLIKNLTRFNTLKALNIESVSGYENWQGRSADIGKELNANYVIEGTVRRNQGKLDVVVRILDTQKTTYVWTYQQQHEQIAESLGELQENITGEISSQIGSPYGIIQNIEQDRVSYMDGPEIAPYKCILSYYAYCNNKSIEGHKRVKVCLEEIVKKDPQNSDVWAYLSWIYGNELRYGHNPTGSKEDIKNRSLDAAQKSLEASPENPRAHQYFANAALLMGNMPLTKSHIKMSVALNPYDSEILADAAWNYGQMGEWEKSKYYGERSIAINLGHARWYHGIVFAYYYQKENYEKALFHSLESYQPGVLTSHIALAVSYVGVGDFEGASRVARQIEERYPKFLEGPEEFINAWSFRQEFVKKLVTDLETAGVNFSKK